MMGRRMKLLIFLSVQSCSPCFCLLILSAIAGSRAVVVGIVVGSGGCCLINSSGDDVRFYATVLMRRQTNNPQREEGLEDGAEDKEAKPKNQSQPGDEQQKGPQRPAWD